jgi:8-oxo-dGTP pyrophosphatase MutT (NUDIX family)
MSENEDSILREAARAVIYRIRDGQAEIFLGRRLGSSNLEKNKFQLIGGAQKGTEFPLDTMIRELIEEIKELTPADERALRNELKAMGRLEDETSSWITRSFFLLITDVLDQDEISLGTEEMEVAHWVTRENLKTILIAFNHPQILDGFFDWIESQPNPEPQSTPPPEPSLSLHHLMSSILLYRTGALLLSKLSSVHKMDKGK